MNAAFRAGLMRAWCEKKYEKKLLTSFGICGKLQLDHTAAAAPAGISSGSSSG
jgi:hypothetical protein